MDVYRGIPSAIVEHQVHRRHRKCAVNALSVLIKNGANVTNELHGFNLPSGGISQPLCFVLLFKTGRRETIEPRDKRLALMLLKSIHLFKYNRLQFAKGFVGRLS